MTDTMDRQLQIELVKAAMMQDVFHSQDQFIELVERMLHYTALVIVTGSNGDDQAVRTAVEVAHHRLDEIVAKTAASARKHMEGK